MDFAPTGHPKISIGAFLSICGFLAPDRPLRLCLRGDQHLRGLAAPRPNQ
jgi:hypothetical protein